MKPGDTIPVAGLNVQVLASAGQVIPRPLTGGGQPNPLCAGFQPKGEDTGENGQSVGNLITFGRFRAVHLGDLTWNKEKDLACPTNKIGTVDLFVVTHHGQPVSNPEVLVHAIQPRVAIMNNGTQKGGQPEAMRVIYTTPGLEDLWQLHFSLFSEGIVSSFDTSLSWKADAVVTSQAVERSYSFTSWPEKPITYILVPSGLKARPAGVASSALTFLN